MSIKQNSGPLVSQPNCNNKLSKKMIRPNLIPLSKWKKIIVEWEK